MRVIKGKYKGKALIYKQDGIRPTKQRVIEGMYNVLQEDIKESTVLDACCGTGSLGIEALSRGAKHVCFVDTQINLVKQNTRSIKENFSIIKSSIVDYITRTTETFDIIFFDPPWDNNDLYETVIEKILINKKILNKDGYFFCEHQKDRLINFSYHKKYSYGKTHISLYKNKTF